MFSTFNFYHWFGRWKNFANGRLMRIWWSYECAKVRGILCRVLCWFDCCLVAALHGAALTAGGAFIRPTYLAAERSNTAVAAAAAAAAGTSSIRYPSPLLPTVIATSNGLQYAMYVWNSLNTKDTFSVKHIDVVIVAHGCKCPPALSSFFWHIGGVSVGYSLFLYRFFLIYFLWRGNCNSSSQEHTVFVADSIF